MIPSLQQGCYSHHKLKTRLAIRTSPVQHYGRPSQPEAVESFVEHLSCFTRINDGMRVHSHLSKGFFFRTANIPRKIRKFGANRSASGAPLISAALAKTVYALLQRTAQPRALWYYKQWYYESCCQNIQDGNIELLLSLPVLHWCRTTKPYQHECNANTVSQNSHIIIFTENCHGNTQITQALECDCCLPCDIGYLCHGKTIRVSGQAKHHKCTHSLCFLFLAMCDLHTLLHFQECTMIASSRHPQEDYLKCCIGATSHFLSFFFFFIFFF